MTAPAGGLQFPWETWPDQIACNIACGDLINGLKQPFMEEGARVHSETYVAAAGAVAGWAAQQSLRTRQSAELTSAETKDGRKFLFGDDLNAMLYHGDRERSAQCVINLILGSAAFSEGGAPRPDVAEMFKHVSATLGTPGEGTPSTPEGHRPAARVDELLKRALPLVLFVFTREQPHKPPPAARLRQSSWSAVAAWSAAAIVNQVIRVTPPTIAATVAIESAIYASKILEPWAVSPTPPTAPAP